MLFGVATTSQAKWLTIHNDFNQFDLEGNPIRTRSGCLCKFGEKYYWYGCDQAMTNQTCYSSDDLLHWKNEGVMLAASRGTNRMDVIYNDSTKTYVMVLKWETGDWCSRGIATSPTPTGPYTKLFDSLVYGIKTGDISVFKDDDGKAYYLYELNDIRNGNDNYSLGFSLMTPDYLGLAKKLQQWGNTDREASMMMKRRGRYYYLTSKMIYIDPSETQYFTATSIEGPWTTKLVPIIAPGNTKKDSWSTQCDFVFPFKGTEDTVQMYCGDRWKRPEAARGGDYVWLPITFTPRDSVVVNYYQDWEVDPDRGIWREIDSKRNLALQKTTTASSVSGSNTANKATDPSTWENYLNSRWESEAGDPQWISVNLGSEMKINRVILKWDSSYAKSFKVQVSTDNSMWEEVYSTTKGRSRAVTDETFATTTARYVRMHGTEGGNTAKGYSLFDFMVLNDDEATATISKPGKSPVPSEAFLTCKNNTIHYSVPSSVSVKLDIVDMRGKRAAILVDGAKHPGVYEAVLPVMVSHGTYLIRLRTDAKTVAILKVGL
ncbi:MAG: discoidin domain-containing protein [Chitinispirillaceae bacterium]|nr:discoidin domain-containing protein [Chitinispirillaceae bacterium]